MNTKAGQEVELTIEYSNKADYNLRSTYYNQKQRDEIYNHFRQLAELNRIHDKDYMNYSINDLLNY